MTAPPRTPSFADDTSVIGLSRDSDKSAFPQRVNQLVQPERPGAEHAEDSGGGSRTSAPSSERSCSRSCSCSSTLQLSSLSQAPPSLFGLELQTSRPEPDCGPWRVHHQSPSALNQDLDCFRTRKEAGNIMKTSRPTHSLQTRTGGQLTTLEL